MPENPSSVLARHANERRWADLTAEERTAATAAACANNPSSIDYWAKRVDPAGHMDEQERIRRATEEQREYFRAMAQERERRRRERREADDVAA